MRGIPITLKPLMLIIAIGIFAVALVNTNSLVYAYVTITSPTKSQQIPAGSTFNIKGTSTTANDTTLPIFITHLFKSYSTAVYIRIY